MKGGALAFIVPLTLVASALADDSGALRAAGRLTEAVAMKGKSPLDPADPAWNAVPSVRLLAYPQVAVPPGVKGGAPTAVEVRTLVSAGTFAVRLA
jgi:hypothetical protein